MALGATKVPLASTAGLAEGDLIVISSPALSVASVNTEHAYVVSSVNGTDVYIDGTAVCDITAQQVIDTGQNGPITVQAFKIAPGLTMRNGTVRVIDSSGSIQALTVRQQYAPLLDGVIFKGKCRYQAYVMYGSYDTVKDCIFRDYGYIPEDGGYANGLPGQPDGLGYGYGLGHARNYKSTVINCHGRNGWHAFDAARGQMWIDYVDCSGYRNAYAFATHECAWHVRYMNCRVVGGAGWLMTRCIHPKLVGCSSDSPGGHVAVFGFYNVTALVKGCDFHADFTVGTPFGVRLDPAGQPMAGAMSAAMPIHWELADTTIRGRCRNSFGAGGAGTLVISNVNLSGGAFFDTIAAQDVTRIKDISLGACLLQHPVAVNATATSKIFVSNVECFEAPATPSNSALIAVNGVPAELRLWGCKAFGPQYILRLLNTTNAIAVKQLTDCHSGFRLVYGDANVTIANVINCTRGNATAHSGSLTVTNTQNSLVLS